MLIEFTTFVQSTPCYPVSLVPEDSKFVTYFRELLSSTGVEGTIVVIVDVEEGESSTAGVDNGGTSADAEGVVSGAAGMTSGVTLGATADASGVTSGVVVVTGVISGVGFGVGVTSDTAEGVEASGVGWGIVVTSGVGVGVAASRLP